MIKFDFILRILTNFILLNNIDMKALIIGATGATGKPLLEDLLEDKNYDSVTIFVRNETGIKNAKLTEHIIDFNKISQYKELIKGDIFYCCFGTTIKDAGSKDEQYKIDFNIPLQFATIAKANDIDTFVLVSSSNADINSRFFYSRIKGELEAEIDKLNFNRYLIFRPGLLERPYTTRKGEIFMVNLINGLNELGILRKQKPLLTTILAQKMIKAVEILNPGKTIIAGDEIIKLN